MAPLSREHHSALAGLPVATFKALQHLGRVPLIPGVSGTRKGFAPIETLVLAAAHSFAASQFVTRERASSICSRGAELLLEQWEAIRRTSERLATVRSAEHVYFGQVTRSYSKIPIPVCGTRKQIHNQLTLPSIAYIDLNISAVAAELRIRAKRWKIDLADFWTEPMDAGCTYQRRAA